MRGAVGALHDDVGHVLTVDGQAQRLADQGIGEGLTLAVDADVVGAQVGVDVEIAAFLGRGQAGDLVGGHALDELGLAAVVGGVRGGVILDQQQGDGVGHDAGGVPAAHVVGVLGEHDALAGGPLGDHVGAVADKGLGLGAPAVAVGLDGRLLHRGHRSERRDLVEVGAGVAQRHGQGLAILAGHDLQRVKVGLGGHVAVGVRVADSVVITGDHAHDGLAVGRGGVGVGQALEAVLKVLGRQVGAVAPLQAVTQGEGPDQAVLADFPAFGLAADDLVVLVDEQQRLKDGDDGVGAVDGTVQRRVQRLGVGAELDGEAGTGGSRIGRFGRVGGLFARRRFRSLAGRRGGTAGSQRESHAAGQSQGDKVLHLHVVFLHC